MYLYIHVWLQVYHKYVYVHISISGPGHICVGVLSAYVAVCTLCINSSSTSHTQSKDVQIKLNHNLRLQSYCHTF